MNKFPVVGKGVCPFLIWQDILLSRRMLVRPLCTAFREFLVNRLSVSRRAEGIHEPADEKGGVGGELRLNC